MALTRDFKETVNARMQRDSEFAIALLDEAISSVLILNPLSHKTSCTKCVALFL
jgi:hypothetical protein